MEVSFNRGFTECPCIQFPDGLCSSYEEHLILILSNATDEGLNTQKLCLIIIAHAFGKFKQQR